MGGIGDPVAERTFLKLPEYIVQAPASPPPTQFDSWVQCDTCGAWHVVPEHVSVAFEGKAFFACRMLSLPCEPKKRAGAKKARVA